MPLSLGELLTAAISGGVASKLLDLVHGEWKRRSGESKTAREIVERHLDPILKAGDELVGKIWSLAATDFSGLHRQKEPDVEFLGVLYLFGQLWSWLQILRRESVYVVLSSVEEGRRLQHFMSALEGTRVRLVSRTVQRGIGEALIENGDKPRVISLFEFASHVQSVEGEQLRRWLAPVEFIIGNPAHTSNRQRILVYGAIVHSMLDTLDPNHKVTQWRPAWGNKLTKRSRKELERRIFPVYLKFVSRPGTYTSAPKQ